MADVLDVQQEYDDLNSVEFNGTLPRFEVKSAPRAPHRDWLGLANRHLKSILIIEDVARAERRQELREVLLHEVGHLMIDDPPWRRQRQPHGPKFAAALREIAARAQSEWVREWVEREILAYREEETTKPDHGTAALKAEVAQLRAENAQLRARHVARIQTLIRDADGKITGSIVERVEGA